MLADVFWLYESETRGKMMIHCASLINSGDFVARVRSLLNIKQLEVLIGGSNNELLQGR